MSGTAYTAMGSQKIGLNGHNHQNVQTLLKDLEVINAESFDNDGERMCAVLAAYALVSRLETPWEFVARLCMGQVSVCYQLSGTRAERFISQHSELH